MNNKEHDLVYIEWIDSFGVSPAWEDISEMKKNEPLICISIGFKVYDGPEHVILVPHFVDENAEMGVPQRAAVT